jgi:hypothetical protein
MFQSNGGAGTPHTFPGSVRDKPTSQYSSCFPSEMQFMTRAVTPEPDGRPSNCTTMSISSGRRHRTAQPCGFTRITRHDSENGCVGSRLVRVTGISHGIRVPDRETCLWRFEFHLQDPRMLAPCRPKIDLNKEAILLRLLLSSCVTELPLFSVPYLACCQRFCHAGRSCFRSCSPFWTDRG